MDICRCISYRCGTYRENIAWLVWTNKRCDTGIIRCCWCCPSNYCSTCSRIITLGKIAWCTCNYWLLCIIDRYCKTTCKDIAMDICRCISNCCSTYWEEITRLMWTNKRCYWTIVRCRWCSPGYYCSIQPCIITLRNIAWCTWNYWLLRIIYCYIIGTLNGITRGIWNCINYICNSYI